jgi:hypothetical protein
MGGNGARRSAEQAANEARIEAQEAKKQQAISERRIQQERKRANQIYMRSLRSRGGGFFEDVAPSVRTGLGQTGNTL